MEISGDRGIRAPKEKVWEAINDPAVLKACIPACESVEKRSETELYATTMLTLGTLAGSFSVKILLSDLDPPNGCTFSGEGKGNDMGSAKGDVRVLLCDEADGTKLSFLMEAELDGKLAELDSQLIDSAAKQFVDHFFVSLAALCAQPISAPAATVFHMAHEDHDHDPSNPHYFGLPVGVIIAAVIAAISVGITIAKFLL